MDIKQIKIAIQSDWDGYREALVSILFSRNELISTINSYLCDNAGKQLRPLLSLLASRICCERGSLPKASYYSAAVAEIIHTASLLHDDVADDGNMRRGVPTVKASFSSAASVLSGDYWLSRGLVALIDNCPIGATYIFTQVIGRLAEGELIQMELANTLKTTKEDYYRVIFNKTSSLFIGALKGGALTAGAPEKDVALFEEYGCHLGNAFQIRDDIFDYSPDIKSGKASGADVKERKITLPLLAALQEAPECESAQMLSLIEAQPADISEVAIEFVHKYNGIAIAQQELEKEVAMAVKAVGQLRSCQEREWLSEIASYVAVRKV